MPVMLSKELSKDIIVGEGGGGLLSGSIVILGAFLFKMLCKF